MRHLGIVVTTLAGWLLVSPTLASEDWKSKAEIWKAEAEKWEAIAKWFEDRYGWINDQYGWCSMNRDLSFGYDRPSCFKPFKPYCAESGNCSEWEVESYRSEVESWIRCREYYIQQARDDAGCALLLIREGIDAAIEGHH